MKKSLLLLACLAAFSLGATAQDTSKSQGNEATSQTQGSGDVYTWTDKEGVEHFTNRPDEAPKSAHPEKMDLSENDRLSVVETEQPAEGAATDDAAAMEEDTRNAQDGRDAGQGGN